MWIGKIHDKELIGLEKAFSLVSQMGQKWDKVTQHPRSPANMFRSQHPLRSLSPPSYLPNTKSYLVNDCPIHLKTWPKVKFIITLYVIQKTFVVLFYY